MFIEVKKNPSTGIYEVNPDITPSVTFYAWGMNSTRMTLSSSPNVGDKVYDSMTGSSYDSCHLHLAGVVEEVGVDPDTGIPYIVFNSNQYSRYSDYDIQIE